MHVLLLSTYFEPDIASTGVLMTDLVDGLSQLGHQITVVTSMPHYDGNRIWPDYRGKIHVQEQFKDLDVRRVYLYVPREKDGLIGRVLNYATFNTLSTLSALLVESYDVVLTPSPPLTNGLAAFILSRLRGVPYVYNVQDIYPDVAIRMGVLNSPRAIAFFKQVERFVYAKADSVSVISEGFRRNLLDKGVPDDKIEVIPNFMDTDFVHPLPRHNDFSIEHNLDGKFVVLFAGNVGMSQGLRKVVDTARLLEDRKDILFLIVGNGAAKPGLQDYAEQLKLENVRFLPFQPHEALPEMYASSEVCLVPLREGFTGESVPCKVFTITAAGRPLVATVDKRSDTHRFVESSECGLWVEPENPEALASAILRLYNDPGLRERLGRNGRAYVEARYTPQVVARQYAALLERVATDRGTSRDKGREMAEREQSSKGEGERLIRE
jgi:colanic acid biosynthesis glycosyl transferase WcaI